MQLSCLSRGACLPPPRKRRRKPGAEKRSVDPLQRKIEGYVGLRTGDDDPGIILCELSQLFLASVVSRNGDAPFAVDAVGARSRFVPAGQDGGSLRDDDEAEAEDYFRPFLGVKEGFDERTEALAVERSEVRLLGDHQGDGGVKESVFIQRILGA